MVLVVIKQVNAAPVHAVVTLRQPVYAIQLAIHILQHRMEKTFNNCSHQIGHRFKLTINATT
jgi:hypothetical protein